MVVGSVSQNHLNMLFDIKLKEENFVIKAHYILNQLSKDESVDKYIFMKDSTNTVDEETLLQRMFDNLHGIKKETLSLAVTAFFNTVAEAVLRGENVSTPLFRVTTTLKGSSYNGKWDKERNSVAVSLQPGKRFRDAAKAVEVEVIGEKEQGLYISTVYDNETGANDKSVTAGCPCTVFGRSLKVEGNDARVGVKLVNADSGVQVSLRRSAVTVNTINKLVVNIPASLEEGQYQLVITNQAKKTKDSYSDNVREIVTDISVNPCLE